MRAFLFEKYYYKKDQQRQGKIYDMLEATYAFFQKEYPDTDPAVCIALLTDKEIWDISTLLKKNPNMISQELPKNIGICELLPYIKDIKINDIEQK